MFAWSSVRRALPLLLAIACGPRAPDASSGAGTGAVHGPGAGTARTAMASPAPTVPRIAPTTPEERAILANLRARLVRGHVPVDLRTAERASALVVLSHDRTDPVARAAALETLPALVADATLRAALGPRQREVDPALVAGLDDADALVRGVALRAALARVAQTEPSPAVRDALHTLARSGRWPEARADILRATLGPSPAEDDPRFVALALELLPGDDLRARVVVLQRLPVGPDGADPARARTAFAIAAGASEPLVRAHALVRLTELGAIDAEACGAARRFATLALDAPDPALRALAACTLRRVGADEAEDRLRGLSADPTAAAFEPVLTVDAWGASALLRGPSLCAPTVAAAAAFMPDGASPLSACGSRR